MRNNRGFTLIELMLVVVILGMLASIALPKVDKAIRRSQEARTKGNLAVLRASIAVYLANSGGSYPMQLEAITVEPGAALNTLPLKFTPPYHPEGNSVSNGGTADLADSRGDWFYFNHSDEAEFGTVRVNCVHSDLNNRSWSSY